MRNYIKFSTNVPNNTKSSGKKMKEILQYIYATACSIQLSELAAKLSSMHTTGVFIYMTTVPSVANILPACNIVTQYKSYYVHVFTGISYIHRWEITKIYTSD